MILVKLSFCPGFWEFAIPARNIKAVEDLRVGRANSRP